MTHNIIKTDNYLLVVDDGEIKEGDYFYYQNKDGSLNGSFGVSKLQFEDYRKINTFLCKKIIAHLPLNNSPILQGVDLLPPLVHPNCCIAKDGGINNMNKGCAERNRCLEQKDDVEKLAEEMGFYDSTEENKGNRTTKSFISGYNKARETYKYTEEDMKGYLQWHKNKGYVSHKESDMDEFIQSLSQPKYPVGFECEMERYDGTTSISKDWNGKPKTTTTPKGKQWVGQYLFQ